MCFCVSLLLLSCLDCLFVWLLFVWHGGEFYMHVVCECACQHNCIIIYFSFACAYLCVHLHIYVFAWMFWFVVFVYFVDICLLCWYSFVYRMWFSVCVKVFVCACDDLFNPKEILSRSLMPVPIRSCLKGVTMVKESP